MVEVLGLVLRCEASEAIRYLCSCGVEYSNGVKGIPLRRDKQILGQTIQGATRSDGGHEY